MGYNPNKIMREMHSQGGGFSQFYGGFMAHFSGRMLYLAIRNTLYYTVYQSVKPRKMTNDITIKHKMILSGLAGGVAGFLTAPFELVSVRQILDTQIKPEWRRNYASIVEGANRLRAGGILWKGAWANAVKHVALNISLTGPYDYAHERLWIVFGDYGFVKPLALVFAAGVSTVATLPFDYAKTRLMQMHSDPHRNRITSSGICDTLGRVFLQEGTVWAPWAGAMTFFAQNLIMMSLIVYSTSAITTSIKRTKKLE